MHTFSVCVFQNAVVLVFFAVRYFDTDGRAARFAWWSERRTVCELPAYAPVYTPRRQTQLCPSTSACQCSMYAIVAGPAASGGQSGAGAAAGFHEPINTCAR